jgi:hypothetical protein
MAWTFEGVISGEQSGCAGRHSTSSNVGNEQPLFVAGEGLMFTIQATARRSTILQS